MGHSNSKTPSSARSTSKVESNSDEQLATPLSPLETAVLHKKHSKAVQLLNQTEDINGVGDTGLSLLHLAVLSNPPVPFHPVRYYDYLCRSQVEKGHIDRIERMIAVLFDRGAKLTQDNYKLNALESLYYCSDRNNQCSLLATILGNSVDITADIVIRYSVWVLLHHKPTNSPKRVTECKEWGPREELYRSMALFVKHGISPGQYLSRISPKCSSIFECCHEVTEADWIECKSTDGPGEMAVNPLLSLNYWEFRVSIWLYLWDFNDPLTFSFDQNLLKILAKSPNFFDARTQQLIERVMHSWVRTDPYRYAHLSEPETERVSVSIHFLTELVKQASRYPDRNKIIEKMIDLNLLKTFLQILSDMILTRKKLNYCVNRFTALSFEIYQLLIVVYGSHWEIPYEHMEIFSTSLIPVIPLLYNSTIPCTTPQSRFIALFDPDINARNVKTGRTPIQEALLYGNIYMVQTLLEGRANPFTVDRDGNSFVDQLNTIINSFSWSSPARQVYEETRNKYVILNKPYPLFTLATNAIVKHNIPFDILGQQPRLYNMILHYLPPT